MLEEPIRSRENRHLHSLKQLTQKKYRQLEGLFLIEGVRNAAEALDCGAEIVEAFCADVLQETEQGAALYRRLEEAAFPVHPLETRLLEQVSPGKSSQGVLLIARQKTHDLADFNALQPRTVLLLDGVQDPGNLGTLLRTAAAAAVDLILLLPGTVELYSPKVVRAAMGAIYRQAIVVCTDPSTAYSWLEERSCSILLAAADGTERYDQMDYSGPVAWLLGNEANGVSSFWRDCADASVSIPCRMESLNVAAAAAVLLYETARQRDFSA